MRFNWGHGILVFLILFFIGLGTMVYISMREKNSAELIEEKYYDKELLFQQQIDGEKNLKKLFPDTLAIDVHADNIVITLPKSASKIDSGSVEFIRPSDKTKDIRLPLMVNDEGAAFLPKRDFVNGLYRVKISWYTNNTFYVKAYNYIVK